MLLDRDAVGPLRCWTAMLLDKSRKIKAYDIKTEATIMVCIGRPYQQ